MDNNSLITGKMRFTIVGYRTNDMQRLPFLGIGRDIHLGCLIYRNNLHVALIGTCIAIGTPIVGKHVAIGVGCTAGAQFHRLAGRSGKAVTMSQYHYGLVIGLFVRLDTPVGTGGKIVLHGLAHIHMGLK